MQLLEVGTCNKKSIMNLMGRVPRAANKMKSRSIPIVEAIQEEEGDKVGEKDGEMGVAVGKVEAVAVMVVDALKLDELLSLEIIRRNFALPNLCVPGGKIPLG
jgi:hypothetical protein